MNGLPVLNFKKILVTEPFRLLHQSRLLSPLLLLYLILVSFSVTLPLQALFDYEYAVTASVLSCVLLPSLLLSHLKNPTFYGWLIFICAVTAFPIIVGLSVVSPFNSDTLTTGIIFFISLQSVSLLFIFSVLLAGTVLSPRKPLIFYYLIFFVICTIPVAEFYFTYSVGVHFIPAGNLPGTIYDEYIPLNADFFVERGLLVGYCLLLVVPLVFLKKKVNGRLVYGWLCIGLFILVFPIFFQPLPAFKTNGFTVYYDRREDSVFANRVSQFGSIYYAGLVKEYELGDTIFPVIRLFSTAKEKKEVIGIGDADMAKPWRNEIFLTKQSAGVTIAHELRHIVAANFGWSPLKISYQINGMLLEGFASADERTLYGVERNKIILALQANLRLPEIQDLSGTFSFFTSYSGLSYLLSGAFCDFLLSTYPQKYFKAVYATGDFTAAYGKSLSILYKEFLLQLPKSDSVSAMTKRLTEFVYNRPTIFERGHIRYEQRMLVKARDLLAERKIDEAEQLLNSYSENVTNLTVYRMLLAINGAQKDSTGFKNIYQRARFLFRGYREVYLLQESYITFPAYNIYPNTAAIAEELQNTAPNIERENLYSLRLREKSFSDPLKDSKGYFKSKKHDSLYFAVVIAYTADVGDNTELIELYFNAGAPHLDNKTAEKFLHKTYFSDTPSQTLKELALTLLKNGYKPKETEMLIVTKLAAELKTDR